MSHTRPLCLLLVLLPCLPAAAAQAAGPDLGVTRAKASARSVAAGSAVTVRFSVRNAGRRHSAPARAGVWISADARRGRGDRRLARTRIRPLRPGRSSKHRMRVTIPDRIRSGPYRLLVCAGACRAIRLTVTSRVAGRPDALPGPVAPLDAAPATPAAPAPEPQPQPDPAGRPDLAVTDVSDPPARVTEGGGFTLAHAVANDGAAAPATTTRFYLSPDSEQSLRERRESAADPRRALDDVLLGGAGDVPALPAGGRSESPGTSVSVPAGTRPGVYHLVACADDRAATAEAVEDANCAVATHPEAGVERPSVVEIVAEAQDYRIDALSDVFEDTDESDEEDLDRSREAFCAPTPDSGARTVDEALASIRAYVNAKAGPEAMAQFAASPEYADADKAETAAAAAVATKRPSAALAALVRAHELEPAESSHLVNLAAIASSVGLPSEALAVLDGADRLDDPDVPAMGISRHAVALANRGQALALLGRHAEAGRAADAALRAEPLLSEAAATKGLASLCAEGAKAAVPHVRKSRTRQGRRRLDVSGGRETRLRDIELPGFTKQAATMKPYYASESDREHQQIADMNVRRDALAKNVRDKRDGWTRAQRNRYFGTFDQLHRVSEHPDIAAKEAEVQRLLDLAWDTERDFWGNGDTDDYRYHELSEDCSGADDFTRCMRESCGPALNIAHQTWLDQMQDAYAAAQVHVGAYSKRYSGIAAHLADPDAFGEAMIGVEDQELGSYASFVQLAFHWTHEVGLHANECVEDPEPLNPDPGAPPAAEGDSCNERTKAISLVAELGPSKVKINCERVQQSLKLEAMPWLFAFAEGTFEYRTGRLTICAGAKGEPSVGVAKGAFKSGLYITFDSNGDVYDAGWRVGRSATVASGPWELQVHKDEFDISFIGGPKPKFGE
ncbi:MAG TPA: hypothetical protein VF533_03105 [Solirubrobacteraceae bacterium]|jgi:hypothetical protein